MSRKPGSHLLKIHSHLPGFAVDPTIAADDVGEQLVILTREDIHGEAPAPPRLDWSKVEKGGIVIRVKDLDGLAEGKVTLKASTLQRLHPLLVPELFDADYLFQVSLKSIVMQVEGSLRRSPDDGPVRGSFEFDTPIAQIAKEDESYLKLEKFRESQEPATEKVAQAKQNSPEPVLTPADRPAARVARKESSHSEPGESTNSAEAPPLLTAPDPPAVSDLKPRLSDADHPKRELRAQNHSQRLGHERLREIFMTEEYLTLENVACRIAGLPKILSALVMSKDGTVLGGCLPEIYRLEAAILAPALLRNVQEFGRRLHLSEPTALTLLAEKPISLFAEGDIHILVCHEGRGLVPGMRKRIGEIASALDDAFAK